MAKNDVVVHLEDRQMSDLKKSMNQSDLKVIREMEKLGKTLERINKQINLLVREFSSLKNYIIDYDNAVKAIKRYSEDSSQDLSASEGCRDDES